MASKAPPGDPRVMARLPEEADAMPVVRRPRSGLPGWAIAGIALVAALILFLILDSRRRDASAPAVRPRAADSLAVAAPPPPLFVPQIPLPVEVPIAPAPAQPAPAPAPAPQIVYVPQPAPPPEPLPPVTVPPPRVGNEAALVFDVGAVAAAGGSAGAAENAEAAPQAAAGAAPGLPPQGGGRARAGVFANRATTVAQGTLIPAVLETALDSTRPGFARAIVSRDVRGFDGSRVLIPRGSRLIGEYRSEVSPGQRRALVNWTRLIRPDGVTIAIGSPAGDPLGRGGIRARVNTPFLRALRRRHPAIGARYRRQPRHRPRQ